jgi:hypothetical protein
LPGVFTQSSVALAPSLADLDGDADQDIFICDQDTSYFFPNLGSPTSPQFGIPIYGWQNLQQPAGRGQASCWNDIDQDGDLDLFWCSSNGYVPLWFYRNLGTPQSPQLVLESQSFLPMNGLHAFSGIDIFDIDQDGDDDFLLSTSSGGGMLFFRNVTGESEVGPKRPIGPPNGKLDLSLGPNPANPVTWVSFTLPSPQEATLAVYNILGAKVTTLASGFQQPGTHSFIWNAAQYSSGVYIIRLETAKVKSAERVVVVK